jgi:RNA polymerase sigma-70 factor, ECF subfamily
VQEVFLKVHLSLPRFRQQAAFSTWLYKITLNECRDHLRRKKVRPLVYESDLSEDEASRLDWIASLARTVDGIDERVERWEILERALDVLAEQDREMMLLKEIIGFSVREVSEILDLNLNTAKIRLFRARGRIMEAYRRGCRFGEAAAWTAATTKPRVNARHLSTVSI